MSLESYLGLCGAMLVVAVTPGPAVFAMITTAFSDGLKRSCYLNLGIMLADYIFIGVAIAGLSALAIVLGDAFYNIRYLCAIYLIWTGYRMFRSASIEVESKGVTNNSIVSTILTGLLITLSNPKAILFYAALLPMFVDLPELTTTDTIMIALTANLTFGSVNFTYAYMAAKVKTTLNLKSNATLFNKATGTLMIAIGALTALKA